MFSGSMGEVPGGLPANSPGVVAVGIEAPGLEGSPVCAPPVSVVFDVRSFNVLGGKMAPLKAS